MGCGGSKKSDYGDRKPVGKDATNVMMDGIKATAASSSAPGTAGVKSRNDKESKPLIDAQANEASLRARDEKASKKNADDEALKKAKEEKERLFAAQAAQQEKIKELEEKKRQLQEAQAEKQRVREEALAKDREELQKRREAQAAAEKERELKEEERKKIKAEEKRLAELDQNLPFWMKMAMPTGKKSPREEERRCLEDGVGYTQAEFLEYFGEAQGATKWEQAKDVEKFLSELPKPPPSEIIHGASLEEDVMKWLEAVSGESKGDLSYMEWLKDGKILCKVVNNIEPNIVPKINQQTLPFKQMENVGNFTKACRKLGVLEKDLFATVDLYEEKNPRAVLHCILNLGGVIRHTAHHFSGPYLGKESSNLVTDHAREKHVVSSTGGLRHDVKHQLREAVNCWNQEEVTEKRDIPIVVPKPVAKKSPRVKGLGKGKSTPDETKDPSAEEAPGAETASTFAEEEIGAATVIKQGSLEADVTAWVQEVTGESMGEVSFMEWLKDGQVICRLANKIQPGIIPKINSDSLPFKQMENVTSFIKACRTLGVLEKDVFSTVDLYEAKNPNAVLSSIYALGGAIQRTVPEFGGPFIGVAQTAAVKDSAREKTAVTQCTGFRNDIDAEVRDGVSRGRHM